MHQKKQCFPKVEFDQALYKRANEVIVRPVSSKQNVIIKSPLPPRKPTLSQHNPKQDYTQQGINIFRTRCITPNSKNLPAIYIQKQTSPIKVQRPSAASEKRIKFFEKKPEKQQFKITTRITLSAGKRGSKSQHESPHGAMQFTWLNQDTVIRNRESKKMREKQIKQPYVPLCAQDFSMTSHKNELPQLLKMYQQQFSDLSHQVPLNMSEIQEANEDGMSSVAQSTLV